MNRRASRSNLPPRTLALLRMGAPAAFAVLLAGAAAADCPGGGLGIPCGTDSDVPCGLNLVGRSGTAADAHSTFTVVVRDIAHNPVAGCDVSVDFSGCAPDIRVAIDQPWPGLAITCAGAGSAVVHATTDGAGQATFSIVGGANNAGTGTPGAGFHCATVRACGDLLGTVNVGAFDENSSGGLNPADISVWLPDFFNSQTVYVSRSDYNCTNTINPADLSMLLAASFGAGSTQSGGDYCH